MRPVEVLFALVNHLERQRVREAGLAGWQGTLEALFSTPPAIEFCPEAIRIPTFHGPVINLKPGELAPWGIF